MPTHAVANYSFGRAPTRPCTTGSGENRKSNHSYEFFLNKARLPVAWMVPGHHKIRMEHYIRICWWICFKESLELITNPTILYLGNFGKNGVLKTFWTDHYFAAFRKRHCNRQVCFENWQCDGVLLVKMNSFFTYCWSSKPFNKRYVIISYAYMTCKVLVTQHVQYPPSHNLIENCRFEAVSLILLMT